MKKYNIGIIGLGYVGLPLAKALSKNFTILGFDINETRVSELINGYDRTGELTKEELKDNIFSITSNPKNLQSCNVYIITVPTPIDAHNQPDLTILTTACQNIAKYLSADDIIVFESTVYPGVTEEICIPILESVSQLKAEKDFFVGYSPERINPGDKEHSIHHIVKVVSAQNSITAKELSFIYGHINQNKIFIAKDIKTAEAAKVIENTQRDINIAFINEITMIFNKLGISSHDVLEAAQTKWNFLPFKPGLVGGHCIGVDPYYLAECSKKTGHHPEVILSGRRTNNQMPFYYANFIHIKLQSILKYGQIPNILILGLAFKENIPDIRNSKVFNLHNSLKSLGHNVDIFDPIVNQQEALEVYSIRLQLKINKKYDCVILAVKHKLFCDYSSKDIKNLLNKNSLAVDLKGSWRIKKLEGVKIWSP